MSPELKKALDLVTNEAQKAADLVQQLLDFSRSSMMETQPVDLIEVVGEATDLLRQAIPENIQLVLEIKPTTCVIDADPTRIQQALMNLALNARDAMPEGGELRFSLSTLRLSPDDEPRVAEIAPGSWVRLVVSDTGVGMSEEVRAHIFEPFFTTKERGEGTGLGLAQVYGIVKQHHGYIDVRSQVGEGTSFRIWLPAHEEPPAQEEEPREVGIPRGHGETILVVEDAEKTRLAMRETLKLLGYRVSTAADGQEGLETALELEGLDLVITDVVMPQMGGEGLLRALREERPALPVVALTGYVSDVDLQALREAGFYAVVSKPLQLEDLAALVHRALRGEGR
jgi:CheY-like chemotaxis protein